MTKYDKQVRAELNAWKKKMKAPPSILGRLSAGTQARLNRLIPKKVHALMTGAVKQMIRAVIYGVDFTTGRPVEFSTLEEAEDKVRRSIAFYSSTAAAEGGLTGAGGILIGLADFPLWLSLKMKMLFEIARLYGYDTKQFNERLYLLYIFQLTFSSQHRRNEIFPVLMHWDKESKKFGNIDSFDWQTFQVEYRDYIDLAKMLQLIPGIGAPVGIYVNLRLTNRLGRTAMNAYRMRRGR